MSNKKKTTALESILDCHAAADDIKDLKNAVVLLAGKGDDQQNVDRDQLLQAVLRGLDNLSQRTRSHAKVAAKESKLPYTEYAANLLRRTKTPLVPKNLATLAKTPTNNNNTEAAAPAGELAQQPPQQAVNESDSTEQSPLEGANAEGDGGVKAAAAAHPQPHANAPPAPLAPLSPPRMEEQETMAAEIEILAAQAAETLAAEVTKEASKEATCVAVDDKPQNPSANKRKKRKRSRKVDQNDQPPMKTAEPAESPASTTGRGRKRKAAPVDKNDKDYAVKGLLALPKNKKRKTGDDATPPAAAIVPTNAPTQNLRTTPQSQCAPSTKASKAKSKQQSPQCDVNDQAEKPLESPVAELGKVAAIQAVLACPKKERPKLIDGWIQKGQIPVQCRRSMLRLVAQYQAGKTVSVEWGRMGRPKNAEAKPGDNGMSGVPLGGVHTALHTTASAVAAAAMKEKPTKKKIPKAKPKTAKKVEPIENPFPVELHPEIDKMRAIQALLACPAKKRGKLIDCWLANRQIAVQTRRSMMRMVARHKEGKHISQEWGRSGRPRYMSPEAIKEKLCDKQHASLEEFRSALDECRAEQGAVTASVSVSTAKRYQAAAVALGSLCDDK